MPLKKKTRLKKNKGITTKPIDGGTKATTEKPFSTEEPSSMEQNKAIEGGCVEESFPTLSPVLVVVEEETYDKNEEEKAEKDEEEKSEEEEKEEG